LLAVGSYAPLSHSCGADSQPVPLPLPNPRPPPSGGAPKKHPTTHRPQLAYAYALGSKTAHRKTLRKFLNFNSRLIPKKSFLKYL